jgi:hypothetical protein
MTAPDDNSNAALPDITQVSTGELLRQYYDSLNDYLNAPLPGAQSSQGVPVAASEDGFPGSGMGAGAIFGLGGKYGGNAMPDFSSLATCMTPYMAAGGLVGGAAGTIMVPEDGDVVDSVRAGAMLGSGLGGLYGWQACSPGGGNGSSAGGRLMSLPPGAEESLSDCDPPKDTICYFYDQVPPSKRHPPFSGSHYHLMQYNQSPDGVCHWNDAGVSEQAPPGSIPCTIPRLGGRR